MSYVERIRQALQFFMEIPYPSATAINKPKEGIYDLANSLFTKHNLGPGFDIVQFVEEKFKARIEYVDLSRWEESEDGSIVVHGRNKFDIYISNFTGALRDRFTIAHELGHYILHSDYGKNKIKAARFGSDRVEWEANWFAAGLLMPTSLFTELYREKCIQDPFRLASMFLVSIPAINVRITTFTRDRI